MARLGRASPQHPNRNIPVVDIPKAPPIVSVFPSTAAASIASYTASVFTQPSGSALAITAAVAIIAGQPVDFVFPTTASVFASALSPANQVRAGLSAASVAAYNPIAANGALSGYAAASVAAYNTSSSVQPVPTVAAVVAAANNGSLPPFSQLPIISLEVAFNNNIFDPLSSMVWTDITQYMNKDATIKYGRQHALDGVSAATLEVTLNDRGGQFTPYNTGSPYYGNGQTTGLVPGKPVRLVTQYGGISYPIYYGYVSSWSPVVMDQMNQDAKLTATDLLGILGKTYLANNSIYPTQVLSASPAAYFRLGDFSSSTDGTTNYTLSDYSNQGGAASVIVPNLPAASVAALPTPFYVGGDTGQFLYDINTQIELGDAGTASSAISQSQQDITSLQQTLANDQQTLTNDTTQLVQSASVAAASLAAAQAAAATLLADAEDALGDAATSLSGTESLLNYSYQLVADANAGGKTNTINSANFTETIAIFANAQAGFTNIAAGALYTAAQQLVAAGTSASTGVAAANSAVTAYGSASQDGCTSTPGVATGTADFVGALSDAFQATGAQATTDGDTTTAGYAYFAVPFAQGESQNAQNANNCIQTLQSDLQNTQSAFNEAQSDASQVSQNQGTVSTDAATVATDEANLAAANAAAITTVANTSAYIRASASVTHPYGGVGWFTTTSLPVGGYYAQTIATISQPTGGPVGAIQVNSNGNVSFTYGGVPKITSASVINAAGNPTNLVNDGNVHMIAWTMTAAAGSVTMYLDGVSQGTFSASGLYPGIQNSGTPYILIGGLPVNGVNQGDFIGTVQDWALFNNSLLNSTEIAAMYVLGSKFQHVHTTTDRTQDCLAIALGQSAYNNLPQNIQGSKLCFAEPNQLIQTTALSYIGQVADSESGYFFQNSGASVMQYPINYVQTNPTSTTSQGVYADNTSTSFHYLAQSFQFPLDDEDLYSTVQIMQSTGADPTTDTGAPVELASLGQFIEAVNPSSALAFGSSTLQRSGIILENQSDLTFLANLLLARYQYPIPRVDGVTLSSADTNNLPQMLGRQIWDRVTVQRAGPGEVNFSQDSVIEAIQHNIDVTTSEWRTTFSLSPYELIFVGSGYANFAPVSVGAYNATVTTH